MENGDKRARIQSLELRGITKRFGSVTANDGISLAIRQGEMIGLLGENGAGKTTLMNVLFGLYRADNGTILINGKEVTIRSPNDAIRLGIGMVHQHFMLIPKHTVAENLALGLSGLPFINPINTLKKRLKRFEEAYGLKTDPDKPVWQLSAGEQQRVEIIKALLRGADLLILDEPTSVLTPQEANELFAIIRRMLTEGHSVIFISHKLEEITGNCSRVTVLKDGMVSAEYADCAVSSKELAKAMVGRDLSFDFAKNAPPSRKPMLTVRELFVRSDKDLPAVKNLSFTVNAGEILGIAGVSGNGQKELAESLAGMRKIEKGRVLLDGKPVGGMNPGKLYAAGLAHIPEERIRFGIVPGMSLHENLFIHGSADRTETMNFSHHGVIDFMPLKNKTAEIVREYRVSTPSVLTKVKYLSGGNIQKLILGRELMRKRKVIIAAHPTYGLDIGATQFIRELLVKKRDEGAAIILISEDLEEVLQISDRCAVMFDGSFTGIFEPGALGLQEIGLLMAGVQAAKKQIGNERCQ